MRKTLLWVVGLVVLGLPGAARAGTIVATLSELGGALEFRVTFDDAGAGPGEIAVTVEVTSGQADLRAVFLDVSDDSLLPDMDASGSDVTDTAFAASSVIDLGQGANVQGSGPCPCDLGVEFGTPGMSGDDIQQTTFVLSHATQPLTLGLFDGETIMVRATSVGDESSREDSIKAASVVPEPTLALLFASVLLAARRRTGSATA